MKKLLIIVFISLGGIVHSEGQGRVEITPEYPKPGDSLVVVYKSNVTGKNNPTIPILEITYGNFYELPYKMDMQPFGSDWRVSFKLPSYAVFATFVINDSEEKIKPSDKRHYEIAVFDKDKKRVEKGYLYQGYSLAPQEGKSPDLKKHQAAFYEKELKLYPDSYEAKLNLLSYKISLAKEKDKEALYKQANDIIAAKFYTDPGKMAYTNLTTMGYLMMGEKTRLDSLREVIKEKYPTSEAGYELRISDLTSLKDTGKAVKSLEELLKNENEQNKKYLTNAHEFLFNYYAAKGNSRQALHHLSFLNKGFTPYTPAKLKSQAEILYSHSVALDTALVLSQRALNYVDTFPISLIRYFPETGYLPANVSREKRKESIKTVTGQLNSLMALILNKQGKSQEAKELMQVAVKGTNDNETLKNVGIFYNANQQFDLAFDAYRKVSFNDAGDTTSYQLMEENYKQWKGTMAGIEPYVQEIQGHWMDEMNKQLEKDLISLPLPDVLSNYVDLKGNPLSPSLIKNKIVIMDFWATWCVPCMHAMPYMEEAYQKYKDDPNVVFMIVNSGSQNELSDAQNWWGNEKYSFPVYYNKDRTIGEKLGFNIIPATFIIDQKGDIRFKTIGFEGKGLARKLIAQIEMLKM